MGAVTSISMCPGTKGFFVGTSLSNRCYNNRCGELALWGRRGGTLLYRYYLARNETEMFL